MHSIHTFFQETLIYRGSAHVPSQMAMGPLESILRFLWPRHRKREMASGHCPDHLLFLSYNSSDHRSFDQCQRANLIDQEENLQKMELNQSERKAYLKGGKCWWEKREDLLLDHFFVIFLDLLFVSFRRFGFHRIEELLPERIWALVI